MRRVDIREIGVERNEEQKRAYNKMLAFHGLNIFLVCLGLWICDYASTLDGFTSTVLLVFTGVVVFFAILTFFSIASDFYEESFTATPEQLEEYARKNNEYVGKTWFEDDEEV